MNPSLLSTQAAVLLAPQTNYSLTTLGLRPPSEGEVLVEMAYAGICHSDENVRTGNRPFPMPVVTGHEGSGIVLTVGPEVESVTVGDHVILNWAISCGTCPECNEGRPTDGKRRSGEIVD